MLCTVLLVSIIIAQAHGSALTTKELAAGQPSFLFILVSAATRARERATCAGLYRARENDQDREFYSLTRTKRLTLQ